MWSFVNIKISSAFIMVEVSCLNAVTKILKNGKLEANKGMQIHYSAVMVFKLMYYIFSSNLSGYFMHKGYIF